MNRRRWETVIHFGSRGGPVRLEISPANEEYSEEISDHPRGNHGNHEPIHQAKSTRGAVCKHTSVEKEEAQFDAA